MVLLLQPRGEVLHRPCIQFMAWFLLAAGSHNPGAIPRVFLQDVLEAFATVLSEMDHAGKLFETREEKTRTLLLQPFWNLRLHSLRMPWSFTPNEPSAKTRVLL